MRYKVANTKYSIQKYTPGEETPGVETPGEGWLLLGKHINTAEPANEEESESEGFLDGDGTPETDVTSVAVGYAFSGYRNYEDPAQNLIADMEFETGEGRKVWFRRELPDGTTHQGLATVTEPALTGGEAVAYDQFASTITWNKKPEEITPAG